MTRVIMLRRFAKDLSKLPSNIRKRVEEGIAVLAGNPWLGKPYEWVTVKDLGKVLTRSFRVGDYRIVYFYEKKSDTIYLLFIDHRRRAYDRFHKRFKR